MLRKSNIKRHGIVDNYLLYFIKRRVGLFLTTKKLQKQWINNFKLFHEFRLSIFFVIVNCFNFKNHFSYPNQIEYELIVPFSIPPGNRKLMAYQVHRIPSNLSIKVAKRNKSYKILPSSWSLSLKILFNNCPSNVKYQLSNH